MNPAEWHSTLFQFISLILSFATFIGSVIAIYFTYQNLKEMKKQLNEQEKQLTEQKEQYFEQNRGNLVFFISRNEVSAFHSLIVKNFGNSPAKLLFLKITPELDWGKAGHPEVGECNISSIKNVFLAPNQHISSGFDFRNYPENSFEIEISYETCHKTFTEKYNINIDFIEKILTAEPQIKDEISGLKNIYKALLSLSNKFM